MQHTVVKRRTHGGEDSTGVYASLDDLVRLQFKASGFSYLPRQPVHSVLSGRHSSRLRGRGLNFEELRTYLPGDDIRAIDWKVTARTGEPYVRVFTEEKDRPVWLLVDQRQSMFFGSRWKMKSVVAAEAAAGSAWRVLSAGDRVGAVIFNDKELKIIPPHRSRNRVMQILGEIVSMNHALKAGRELAPNGAMLNRALQRVATLARHDALLVLISDGFGMDEETTQHVTNMSEHNDVMTLFIHDPMERALPDSGRLVFSDGEKQLEVNTADAKLRAGYAQEFEDRLSSMESISRRFAIPMIPIHTAEPVLDQVRDRLGHHAGTNRS